jgi:hypothetical protein
MSTPRIPQLHRLKIWPERMTEVNSGRRFDIRRDDRDFQVGDLVIFEEWKPVSEGAEPRETTGAYTGAFFGPVEITSLMQSIPLPDGWCGFGFVTLVHSENITKEVHLKIIRELAARMMQSGE